MLAALRASKRAPRIVSTYSRAVKHTSRRNYASVTDLSALPKPGARLHGFTLRRAEHVPELELSALHFQHDKTGADYLHIAREDQNNVFGIGFKTNAPDATGVPHILEHVTLCGSERYPVRDPFFKMIPRSLQNFMNAMTSSDYTLYPFATTNAQDFKNLMGVYLDATLHPLLKHGDFVQEGWRLGPQDPLAPADEQEAKDLVFKGVVYNEMKGNMSDATYLFYIRFMEHIFPSLNNSGGDPAKMTELTYERLRAFHEAHYHPSNSKIITYGDQPVEGHLQMLREQLDRFSQVDVDREIKLPIDLANGPKRVTIQGPVDPLTPSNAQHKTSTTWLMGDTTNIAESFALQIATSILTDGYGSPMYRALIESGLGTEFTPNTGYDTSGSKGIFSIGLNGVTEENVPKVQEAIAATLQDAVTKGFDKQKVEGVLQPLELARKHKAAHFGLNLMQRLAPGWFNGIDPFDALSWNSIVNNFKAEYAKGGYLEGLVRQYLLNNNTLTFTMVPSQTYGAHVTTEEAQRLENKIAEAVKQFPSEGEAHKHLRERELELLEQQEGGRTENLDSLPTLHVTDIPRKDKSIDLRFGNMGNGTKVQWRETATNGITYFRALSLFEDLPDELRMLVPLFCDSLMRIGTKERSMEELEDFIKLKTGGISFGHHARTSPFDTQKAEEGLGLVGHALDRNVSAMFEVIRTILLETDFDSPKAYKMIRQLLQSNASGALDAIAEGGHIFARSYATAGLTPRERIVEQTSGLTQVKLIAHLAATEEDPEAMAELVKKLKAIQAIAVTNLGKGSRVAFTCGNDASSANEDALQKFLSNMSAAKLAQPNLKYFVRGQEYPAEGKTFFNFPYQVSYAALALPIGPYTDSSTASFPILAQLLSHKHLHHEIREKGGAYGGFAFCDASAGTFGMSSYRDPNPENTLRIMRDAGRWALDRDWTDRELEEAKLAVFQALDAPRSVNAEGLNLFLAGIDQEMQQGRRERLLDVDKRQVIEAAEKINEGVEKASVALLGERKAFVKESDGWRVQDIGLAPAADPPDAEIHGEQVATAA